MSKKAKKIEDACISIQYVLDFREFFLYFLDFTNEWVNLKDLTSAIGSSWN